MPLPPYQTPNDAAELFFRPLARVPRVPVNVALLEAATFPLVVLIGFYFQEHIARFSLLLAILGTLVSLHGLVVLALIRRHALFGLLLAIYLGGLTVSWTPIWFEHPERWRSQSAHSFWSVPHRHPFILR